MNDYFSKLMSGEDEKPKPIKIQTPFIDLSMDNYSALPTNIPKIPVLIPKIEIPTSNFQLEQAEFRLTMAKSRANQEGYGSYHYWREEEEVRRLGGKPDKF